MSSQTLQTRTGKHSGSTTEPPATPKPYRTRRLPAAGTVGRYVALAVAAALTLGPVLWTLSTSLRTPSESFNLPPSFLPINPDFTAYQEV
ncbi:MAG: carbohydrate ABC transporter permease, partial [Arthrobacter sp.]